MDPYQRTLEKHKRAARRNFLVGSKDEQTKNREKYKPANLRGIVKVKGLEKAVDTTEKMTKAELHTFVELQFREKVRKCANRVHCKDQLGDQRIFYTQLSKSRRNEKPKDKPVTQLKNCRQYLDFMESYILGVVKEHNQ